MATNQIRGNTQIIDATIENAQIAAAAAIATTKLADGANFIQRDGSVAFTADQSMGSNKLTSVATPTADTDAANKAYVDSAISGLDFQADVLDIQVDATLDPGVSPTTGDRYLIENSAALHANFGTITGVADDDIVEFDGADFVVSYDVSLQGEGALVWDQDSNGFYFYDGTAWAAFGGLTGVTAGTGLSKTGNTLNVGDVNRGVQVNADDLEIDASEIVETSGGLKAGINSWELAVEPADFAGTGLEDDGSDNLRLATQGNGISGGAGSTLSVDVDSETGGNIQPVNLTATGVGVDIAAIAGTGLTADGSANLDVDTSTILAVADLVLNETPTGLINSANTTYTTAAAPNSLADLCVYLNGVRQRITTDYTLSGSNITMTTAPTTGDNLVVDYKK